jgi:hypothetical protein
VTERRGRRRKQLLDDRKEKRRYWKLKEEARDCTLWITRYLFLSYVYVGITENLYFKPCVLADIGKGGSFSFGILFFVETLKIFFPIDDFCVVCS